MTVTEFIIKWRKVELTERSAAQQHFLDLCEVFDHPKPADVDPTGESFTFERGAAKHGGGDGWADIWKKGFFAFEYKGKHKDLKAAYDQLLKYREALENPPLLVVCDMDRLVIHTNFTGTAKQVHDIPLTELNTPRNIEIVRHLFHDPDRLRPGVTSVAITSEAAGRLAAIAERMRGRDLDPTKVAHFLDRIVFCLFAEDVGLLPEQLFSRIVAKSDRDPQRFGRLIGQLFEAMANGGDFGVDTISHFDGNLFTDAAVLPLTSAEIDSIQAATKLDWGAVEGSIFGTLFERGMDPTKRSQLGAHFTGRADIETVVDPVVMVPLRREWAEVRQVADNLLATGKPKPSPAERKRATAPGGMTPKVKAKARSEAAVLVHDFLQRLQHVTVLDPACGSGNFLYVTLLKLKDLEKEVLVYAADNDLGNFFPGVGPWQLYGIELSRYAHDLAQLSIWIGWLQWTRANGYKVLQEPILRPLDNFRRMDAIIDLTDPANPREPEWPEAEFIVSNPPFLGGKKLRAKLKDDIVNAMFKVWRECVRPEADLCCYWFEKARAMVETGKCRRAGLLATQGIRGGANRETLKRIKETGDIFFAESDRDWVLDGATVHVSMVGFDNGDDTTKTLDGRPVSTINSDLTSTAADVTTARRLAENLGVAYMGDTKGGAFDIPEVLALEFLHDPNPTGQPNSNVVVPWINGLDVTRRNRNYWIIDFGLGTAMESASLYDTPFSYVKSHVESVRGESRTTIKSWWLHERPRVEMRQELRPLTRFVVTARVAKHRLFVWLSAPTLPDSQVFAFARDDDYFLGVLHSRVHEVWARSQGTQLRERESGFRYTPTTCFETFPFPEADDAHKAAIAVAAKALDELRTNWLNPPEWTREEVLEFPGSADGPWVRFVHDPDSRGIGTVRYPRRVPRDAACATKLAKRTLTNLYNERPTWLDLAHKKLDAAVFAAYGWAPDLSDGDLLARLLELNLARDPSRGVSPPETGDEE
jgi:hypothetical protein